MKNLTRTKQGNIPIEETNTLEEIQQGIFQIHTLEQVLNEPVITVNEAQSKKISNGVEIENLWNIIDKVIFKNEKNKILGIYEKKNNILKTWKNF